MPNMSYCRFRNTLSDLQDCVDFLQEMIDQTGDPEELISFKMNVEEVSAASNLLQLADELSAMMDQDEFHGAVLDIPNEFPDGDEEDED